MVNMNNNYNAYQNKGGRVYLSHNHHLLESNVAYRNLNLGNFWAEIYIHGHILASKTQWWDTRHFPNYKGCNPLKHHSW